jgi:TM2 domain-containing membrane protein YozV
MNQDDMYSSLPGIQPDELLVIQAVIKDMNDTQRQQFFAFYKSRRKDQQMLLIMTLIGFFGFAGIQRFVTGDIVMGIIFFITMGFCGIGTIVDLINIRKITSDFNQKEAVETANLVKMMK